jgi:hypothetical protein
MEELINHLMNGLVVLVLLVLWGVVRLAWRKR